MKTKFKLSMEQLNGLKESFNELVSLYNKANKSNTPRVDIFRVVLNKSVKIWAKLPETSSKSPMHIIVDVMGKMGNEFVGDITAAYELKDGEAIALSVKLSTSTGRAAYYVGKPLPFFAGNENMIRSLAKKATKAGSAFAIECRKGDKIETTTYVVSERTENAFKEDGTPYSVVKKVATKATGWVRLYHPSEQSFKKGIIKGLQRIA